MLLRQIKINYKSVPRDCGNSIRSVVLIRPPSSQRKIKMWRKTSFLPIIWLPMIQKIRDRLILPRDAMVARYILSGVCLTVCPSVHPSVSKRLDKWSWLLAQKLGFLRKKVLPFGTSSQTLNLENFATNSRSCCQQNSRRSSLLTTLTTVDASWLFTTRPSTVDYCCNSITSICCGFDVQLLSTTTVDKITTDILSESRGPSVVAQLLMTQNTRLRSSADALNLRPFKSPFAFRKKWIRHCGQLSYLSQ